MEMRLVFEAKEVTVSSMDKPWYRKFFSRSQEPVEQAAEVTPDYEDSEVQFSMGLKFANGQGPALDFVQAAEWYQKAAAQNHTLAQFNLGMMYASGQGIERDDAKAAMWFGKAAHRGDAGAQFNLGKSCQRASFKMQPAEAAESRIEAYKWFHLAAAQGYKGSENGYATITQKMTHADVTDGDRRVASFEVRTPERHPA
jgi:TPR repeat protein